MAATGIEEEEEEEEEEEGRRRGRGREEEDETLNKRRSTINSGGTKKNLSNFY
jgi:hypothetical protein